MGDDTARKSADGSDESKLAASSLVTAHAVGDKVIRCSDVAANQIESHSQIEVTAHAGGDEVTRCSGMLPRPPEKFIAEPQTRVAPWLGGVSLGDPLAVKNS